MRPVRWGRAVAVLVAWTAFVWVGRIRNALADAALDDGGRTGPLLLSLSFLVPAAVVGVLALRSRGARPGPALRWTLAAFAAWTVGLWLVRTADIALLGDHEAAFVAVHAVLGVVSAVTAVVAAVAVWRARPARPARAAADGTV